jgi:hypothetical protein
MPMNPRLLRPTAPSGFDPRRIAGLALWLDAADFSTLGNTSGGPGGVSNNSPVKYWGDKSGNGRNATSSGADSVVPTYLSSGVNGAPSLSFDGNDVLDGTWSLTLTSETVFFVGTMRTGTESGGRIWTQSDVDQDSVTAGGYIPMLRDSANNGIASFSATFRAASSVSLNTPLVFISRHTGSQVQNSVNNQSAQTSNFTLNKTFTRYRMGARFTDSIARLDGNIAEVLVFSRNVSDSERDTVARYLGRKWGVTVA